MNRDILKLIKVLTKRVFQHTFLGYRWCFACGKRLEKTSLGSLFCPDCGQYRS